LKKRSADFHFTAGMLFGGLAGLAALAQLMLGRYLKSGAAGDRDPVEARLWLERAITQGVPEAEADLVQLG
jgi:TPR repeat protein